MRRFVWTSDIHLDRMEESEFSEFTEYLEELKPDGFILAGDIAKSDSVAGFLKKFLVPFLPAFFYLYSFAKQMFSDRQNLKYKTL